MIFTRKIGKLIRGNTTPFQIYAATLLGAFLGFNPGFDHAPGLILFWVFLLLILNANLFLAGIVGLLSKLIYLVTLPIAFSIGRMLLEGPTQGLFQMLHNGPVTAYFGLDYYVVTGGLLLAVVIGIAFGILFSKGLTSYRNRMLKREAESGGSVKAKKGWVKAFEFVFVGKKSGKSYEELLARKIGIPVRIPGVILVVLMIGGLVLMSRFFTDSLIAQMARDGLSKANGATVDLESAHLDLKAGKLELVNVAFADPNNLETDILKSSRVMADVSAADLLRKRFSIDKLVVDSASSGLSRENTGELVGPRSKPSQMPELEMPDFKDLDSVLENAEVWKERLTQLKRWMEKVSAISKPEILNTPQQWEEELSNRIRSVGYANVKATMLTQDSPMLLLRDLEALGVKTTYLDGTLLDIKASNLSTHPQLVEEPPFISMVSKDGVLKANLSLGLASGMNENVLDFEYDAIPTSLLRDTVQVDGKPVLEGGTIDLKINGDLNGIDSDLLATAFFNDVVLLIAGARTPLNGVEMPIAIKGPIDAPRIKVEADFLKNALKSAGKKKLLDEASKELGIDLGDDTSSGGLQEAAGSLLGGFLKKKSGDEKKD